MDISDAILKLLTIRKLSAPVKGPTTPQMGDVQLPNESGTSDLYHIGSRVGPTSTQDQANVLTPGGVAARLGPQGLFMRGQIHTQPKGGHEIPEGAFDNPLALQLLLRQAGFGK